MIIIKFLAPIFLNIENTNLRQLDTDILKSTLYLNISCNNFKICLDGCKSINNLSIHKNTFSAIIIQIIYYIQYLLSKSEIWYISGVLNIINT